MLLKDQLLAIAHGVEDAELKLHARNRVLDAIMDGFNDLNKWALDTEHEAAANEVMAIVDRTLGAISRDGMPTSTRKR